MSLVVNNNLMAANVARNLNAHYGRLQTSTQRLSSGLRVNSAADDAAGLAIRELQRADIAALHQGARNANDAISMIQVADGALGVIDEKLIRMKELAEQAATGTYSSTQRLMIESEYQAMASEITRIANATDFNGIKLLDGTLSGAHDGSGRTGIGKNGKPDGLTSTGQMKIHFGTANDSAEDYYYVTIGNCTAGALGVGNSAFVYTSKFETKYFLGDEEIFKKDPAFINTNGAVLPNQPTTSYKLLQDKDNATKQYYMDPVSGGYKTPAGADATLTDAEIANLVDAKNDDYGQLYADGANPAFAKAEYFKKDGTALTVDEVAKIETRQVQQMTTKYTFNGEEVTPEQGFYDATGNVMLDTSTIGELYSDGTAGGTQYYKLGDDFYEWKTGVLPPATEWTVMAAPPTGVTAQGSYVDMKDLTQQTLPAVTQGNIFKKADGTYLTLDEAKQVKSEEVPVGGRVPSDGYTVSTQEAAQKALNAINDAIESKDKIRAHLGAMQNRLENTITNLNVQAENLQAAESRISDVDVATEMTQFVRNQILTQSAVAMLGQANSLPQMAMQLIGG